MQAIIYIKAAVVLLVLWRVLTLGIFGQVVGGILAAFLAYCLTRRSSSVPKQVQHGSNLGFVLLYTRVQLWLIEMVQAA